MRPEGGYLRRFGTLAIVGFGCVACGHGTTSANSNLAAQAHLMSYQQLAAGSLGAPATGGQFVRVTGFDQRPGNVTPSKKHQVGIIYQAAGIQRLRYFNAQGVPAQTIDIRAGSALFLQDVTHSHANIGSSTNHWYFIALWPSSQRDEVVGSGVALYDSQDVGPLAPGTYVETLRMVTLGARGHSAAHKFGGFEVVFLLDGDLNVDVAGRPPVSLSAETGTYVPPGTPSQEFDPGPGPAQYLSFVVIAQGKPFETDLSKSPGG